MDHQALQQDMKEAIANSRLLREQTEAAIARARELYSSTLKWRRRCRRHLRLVDDDTKRG